MCLLGLVCVWCIHLESLVSVSMSKVKVKVSEEASPGGIHTQTYIVIHSLVLVIDSTFAEKALHVTFKGHLVQVVFESHG